MKVESIRGMRDILPEETPLWQKLEAEIRSAFALYGYREIRVPLVERAELFSRGVGEETEVVDKQMYVFPDRKGLLLALRPEATASVVRAYVEHGLHAKGDLAKLYYLGPMFRYEKPQLGRQRQFHQYGVESIGSLDPALDAEVMDLAWHLMERLLVRDPSSEVRDPEPPGLPTDNGPRSTVPGPRPTDHGQRSPDHGLLLRLNSIGCRDDRPLYREALQGYFAAQAGDLCPECRRRLETNPLRILDCKEEGCRALSREAPRSVDHLCPECGQHFADVQAHLASLGLAHEFDPTLVRGLDYYTRTVFELCSRDLGAQDALLGGGRYDGLVELLGGSPTPAVGFAGGMERLAIALSAQQGVEGASESSLDLYLVPIGDEAKREGARLLAALRRRGLSVDTDYMGRSLRKAMQVAGRSARYAAILGQDELTRGEIKLKNLSSGEEKPVPLPQFRTDPGAFLR
ncbi:MAG: Histidyl-tRNA synthetase [Candidatus Bipolaricaulis sibiricus]|uniref:Histidine--tRNA ligase n=1 Tax=Bipolaricaulis sibiricus TaxID=2501609 RepID=A0A410FWR9_BIPS1|nr:MAG: Histidyl-tRNA synthetase [Candidatus Bipolaricaulis sibiricus]